MARPALEVADIFRDHGAAWRHANRGHVSLLQLKVMSAIENCRTAALGGHVARARTAPTPRSPTTAAATGTARSARAPQRASGWRRARPNCSRSPPANVSARVAGSMRGRLSLISLRIHQRDTPEMEPILATIAAFLTFAGTGGMVGTLGYVAHYSLGVSRQMIREYAMISALLVRSLVIVGMFASTSGTRK